MPVGGVFCLSAVVSDLPKVGKPFFNDLGASCLDYVHDIAQGSGGNAGVVVAQVTSPGLGDPDFRGISAGGTQADMDMNGFQGVVFVGPKINPV